MNSGNRLLDLSFEFSLSIIKYAEELEQQRKYAIASQIIRSGTSVGANAREAQSAESKIDFVHKLKISEKEAVETEYWLSLCKESENYPFHDELLTQVQELIRLLTSIINSCKKNM